jgi:hypothetical protein
MNKVDESQRMTVDELGNWQYPSAAATGYVEIELPALPGSPNPTERLHARDFGGHVASKIESAINRGYLKSGSQLDPVATLRHYLGAAQGAHLMDPAALKRMETLATEFESEPERQEYFSQVLKPYLHSLTPKRR